jgi:acetoin utilization protein AcuB
MFIKDYMSSEVSTILENNKIIDAVHLMEEKNINSLIVVDADNKPIGTLSSYTLIREAVPTFLKGSSTVSSSGAEGVFDRYARMEKDRLVKEVMHTDFIQLKINDPMIEAAINSIKTNRKIMPVVDEAGKLVGIMTRSNIKKALFDAMKK